MAVCGKGKKQPLLPWQKRPVTCKPGSLASGQMLFQRTTRYAGAAVCVVVG